MTDIMNTIITGDCLVESDNIPSGSVDLILTDLPYGTIKGLGGDLEKYKRLSTSEWDNVIDTRSIYEIANRILRKNGKMVLFSQQPFTNELVSNVNPNIPFSYTMFWDKMHFANCLIAKKAPVNYMEEILVFSKTHDTDGVHPLRLYFKRVLDFIGLPKKSIINVIGQRADHTFRTNSTQYGLCTETTYEDIITLFKINEMDGFIEYAELKNVDEQFKRDLPSTFNLWEGGKYKSNILRYKKDYNGYHPTQKPVLLLEDLIRTFSNEGDTVVDLTAGSGSTAVAAVNTGRNFIAIEQDVKYADIARQRIFDAMKTEVSGGVVVE